MTNNLYLHFSENELRCRCGKCGLGQGHMSPTFMEKLEWLRDEVGFPLPVTSAVRCEEHNAKVSTVAITPPHTMLAFEGIDIGQPFCHSVDINVWGEKLTKILNTIFVFEMGFTGIGLKQTGPYHQRFLHLDDLPSSMNSNRKRPWIWTY